MARPGDDDRILEKGQVGEYVGLRIQPRQPPGGAGVAGSPLFTNQERNSHHDRTHTTTAPTVEPHPKASVSASEAAQMIEWHKAELTAGKITQEQANKIFDQLGATPEQRAPDTRSDEARQLDATFPPGKPSDYASCMAFPSQDVPIALELKAFDTNARTWLSDAQFPRDVGTSLVNAIAKVAQQTQRMNPDELETYGYAELAKLEKAYGPALDEKLRQAGRMVEALEKKTPGLKNFLKSKGLGDNAFIVSMLIQQAERWHASRGLRGCDDHAPVPPAFTRAANPSRSP
jgi:hypothetical protein